MRDLAGFYARVVQEMGLSPIDVIGFSLGGWIVAEMAANCAQQFRRMVLVAPAGIRPPEGDIMDMFTVSARAYLHASVHDPAQTSEFPLLYGGAPTPEQFEAWEEARAETARLAWRPYLYNPSLGPLLEGVRGLPRSLHSNPPRRRSQPAPRRDSPSLFRRRRYPDGSEIQLQGTRNRSSALDRLAENRGPTSNIRMEQGMF